jgi:hypothetical protein
MRPWSLILTLLLTGILFANVAEADENDFLLQITSPEPQMTLAEAPSECNATSAEPLPLANVIFADDLKVCGQCSAPYCRGAELYSNCPDGRKCVPSGSCGAEIPRCYCLSKP